MDKNVEKIKELLEDGYKIIKHQISFRKDHNQDILENNVTFKKGHNLKTITSINSKEFIEFIKHFKKVKDKYDNFEFVYIEDIEQYNKKLVKKRSRSYRSQRLPYIKN